MKKLILFLTLGAIAGYAAYEIGSEVRHANIEKQREAKCLTENFGVYFQGECFAPEELHARIMEACKALDHPNVYCILEGLSR